MPSELLMTVPNKLLVAAFQSLGYSSFKDVNVLRASSVPFFIFATKKNSKQKTIRCEQGSIFNVRPITDMRCGQLYFHLASYPSVEVFQETT